MRGATISVGIIANKETCVRVIGEGRRLVSGPSDHLFRLYRVLVGS